MSEENTPAPAADPAPAPAPVTNPRDAFISMLPEDLRTEGVFANFKDVGDLARSYASAAKMVGMDKGAILAVPRDDSPEAWETVYSKLGRPEAPDKYNIDPFKEHVQDEAKLKEYVAEAHKAGLNQKQVDTLFGKFFSDTKAVTEAMEAQKQAQFDAWGAELKKEYGLAHDQKLATAVNALEKLGGPEFIKMIEENPSIFKNPHFVKFAVNIAEKTGEGNTLLANGSTTAGALSPADAMQQLSALKSDPVYMAAIMDKGHPRHDYFVAQQQKLFEFAFPAETK